jgi:murein DD-endopeptidase MepM/ murein hydrolase activator NlpD
LIHIDNLQKTGRTRYTQPGCQIDDILTMSGFNPFDVQRPTWSFLDLNNFRSLVNSSALEVFDTISTQSARFLQSVHRHPHRLAAAVAVMLLSMGGGAFALASIESNSKEVVVRDILESLPLSEDKQSFAALPVAPLSLFRTTTTRSNDTADTLLKRLGLFDSAAAAYLRSNKELHQSLLGRTGRVVSVEANDNRQLLKLTARWVNKAEDGKDSDNTFKRLVIEKTSTGFVSSQVTAPLQAAQALGSATISSSLFAATDEASIPDTVAVQLAEIFSGQIDFRRLRKGDRLSVVYEALQADGETMRSGKVLSAEFVNNGKSNQAVLFQDASMNASKGQYYTFDGQSLRKAFLASPLEFTRMSSGYGIRVHPITNDKRAHKGIDYAAPSGTPIRTVGDGVVEFAGTQNGYGNAIEIKHRDGKSTFFAHLSRIDVKKGQNVEQGSLIGAVGTTGFSTGPHLHFEFRVDGEHRDPLTLVAEGGGAAPLTASSKLVFDKTSALMRGQLAQASTVKLASAE